MFKLTPAQANAIQELNWTGEIDEYSTEDQALYAAIATRSLTAEQVQDLDIHFVVEHAAQQLDDCEDFGEACDRIGYVSRLRSMRKVQAKVARYLEQHADEVEANPAAWNSQQTGGY